jgi:hypothetical protein
MKKIPTVHELRRQGYKVRVTHIRKFYRFDPMTGRKQEFFAPFQSSKFTKNHPDSPLVAEKSKYEEFFMSARGGETVVELNFGGKEIGKGVSVCSESDAYIKKYGVKKALGKALQSAKANEDPYFSIRKLFAPKKKTA